LISDVIRTIAGRPLDAALAVDLNARYPAGGEEFKRLAAACDAAITAGWMCKYEAGGIRYGRVIKPGTATHGFSVDVVDMDSVKGPHHTHPLGEIDLVMPVDSGAQFDGQPAGWVVYPPASAHHPTVSQGRARVLYLLPEGAIEFTK
jgi:hypothetical protein